jgi:hypothetical protein
LAVEDAWEKLHKALLMLAVARGVIFDRLLMASPELGDVNPDDLPEDLRPVLAEIQRRITAVDPRGELGPFGPYAASISAMTEDEAVSIAEKVAGLYDRLTRLSR